MNEERRIHDWQRCFFVSSRGRPRPGGALTSNIANAMKGVSDEIRQRQIGHFTNADPAYGAAVARKLAA